MGIIKEFKRLGTKNLRGYEKALDLDNPEALNIFFEKSGSKASDFPAEVIHKNLADKHALAISVETAKEEVKTGNMTTFTEMVNHYFADDKKDKAIPFTAIKSVYSQDDSSVGVQQAKAHYAHKLAEWSENDIKNKGYDGQAYCEGYTSNLSTIIVMNCDAMQSLVNNGHINEAKQIFNTFREDIDIYNRTELLQGKSFSRWLAHKANNCFENEASEKLGGFLADQLNSEGQNLFAREYGYPVEKLAGNVSPETQAELLVSYIGEKYRNGHYLDSELVKTIAEALKTENGVVTPVQEKAEMLVENFTGYISSTDRAVIRNAEIDEIRKGNPLATGKYLKNYSSFIDLLVEDNHKNTIKDYAARLSYDDNGNETPAKPFVVNVLMSKIERMAIKKDTIIDVRKDIFWPEVSDAVEAVASTGSLEDTETLKTLYELQVKRHENNSEFINRHIPCIDNMEAEMKNEHRLLCGAREVLAETKQKLEMLKL